MYLFFNQFENTEVYNSGKERSDWMFGNAVSEPCCCLLWLSSSVYSITCQSTLKSFWKAGFWPSFYWSYRFSLQFSLLFLWITRKHYLFFSMKLLDLCSFYIEPLFPFLLFLFSIFLHINSQNRPACKCHNSDPQLR